ncbi:MAG: diaminopimelate epimerase [Dehalococcoidia bacterium]|nr:diaminopimelate epimerase [Dehalococcoidia bacterium]
MRFAKLHGSGNDFIVIDARETQRDWPRLAEAICDRHFGAGADGLLLVRPSSAAGLRMGLYNADGSEAETSGNGLRCFVKYAVDRGLIRPRDGAVTIETAAGVPLAQVTLAGGRVQSVRIGMGRPRFAPQEVPVAVEAQPPITDLSLEVDGRTLHVACVSMGNPHAVQFVSEPVSGYPLEQVGPLVERHQLFPNRVNFEVARVLDRGHVEARTWERGVGETLACGTGACAVMVAARLTGQVGERVEVRELGGPLTLEWDGEGEVYLTGPAVEVFEGEWRDENQEPRARNR